MKIHLSHPSHLRNAALSVLFMLGTGSPLSAATYFWDNNGTSPGFGIAGGTEAAPTISLWSTDPTGISAPGPSVTTLGTDLLNFGTATTGLGAGTISVSGTVNVANLTYGAASGNILLSGGTIAMGGTSGLFTVNNTSNTIDSVLTGTAGLTKTGTGSLLLGGVNSFTGTATINAGTLVANGDTAGVLVSGKAFTLAGGTFNYSSSNGSANALTIGNVAVNIGGNSIKSEETGAGSSTLTVGTLSRATGATVNLVTSGVGAAINSTPAIALNRGIFYNGDYAVAASPGAVGAVVYGTTANTFSVIGAIGTVAGTGSQYNLTGDSSINTQNLGGGGTIRFGGNFALTGTGANTISGFLTNGATGASIGGSGTLRVNGEMVIATNGSSDLLTISNNVTTFNNTATTTVSKSGPGKLIFSGNNIYNGNTYVAQGTLQTTSGTGLGFGGQTAAINIGNSNTTVASGATLDLAPTVAMTVNEAIILTGAALTNSGTGTTTIDSGIASVNLTNLGSGGGAGAGTVAFGGTGSGATATANVVGGVLSNMTLTAAGTGYTGATPVTFTIAGQTTPTAATAILSSLTLNGTANTIGGTGNFVINAAIANGASAGGFTKIGGGTLTLTGVNTYTGGTSVTGGTILLSSDITGAVLVNGGNLKSNVANVSLGSGAVSMTSGSINPRDIGTAGSFTLASSQNLITTGGTFNLDLGTSFDQMIGSGTGTFTLANSTLALTLGSGFSYGDTYAVFSGFNSGSSSNLGITGYDTTNYLASLSNAGNLSFAAVPEPSTALLGGLGLVSVMLLRRKR